MTCLVKGCMNSIFKSLLVSYFNMQKLMLLGAKLCFSYSSISPVIGRSSLCFMHFLFQSVANLSFFGSYSQMYIRKCTAFVTYFVRFSCFLLLGIACQVSKQLNS